MPWKPSELSVELNLSLETPLFKLPGFKLGGKWKPDPKERDAAWQMYVELVTRISVAELPSGEGLLREALTSLYSLFGTTREILKTQGPGVAQPKLPDSQLSFGYIAVAVLNVVLRPVLARWHPALQEWESRRKPSVAPSVHERNWVHAEELREVLNATRLVMIDYARLLQDAAGVEALIIEQSSK